MTEQSILVLGPQCGIACSLDGDTAIELARYAMGYYESLFTTLSVTYSDGKAAFLLDVLTKGYKECRAVTNWTDAAEIVVFDFDRFTATEKDQLDHDTFREVRALQLILEKFTSVL